MVGKSLPVVTRQHFFLDPVFSEYWDFLESGHVIHSNTDTPKNGATETRLREQKTATSEIVNLPWRWNNVGKFMEQFTGSRLDEQISPDIQTYKRYYRILLNVKYFLPEELEISLTDRTIAVKGKHDEREDNHGGVSRSFNRKYIVPSDVMMDRIECNLSSDGILHIKAPRTLRRENSIKIHKKDRLESTESVSSSKVPCESSPPSYSEVFFPFQEFGAFAFSPDFIANAMGPVWHPDHQLPNSKFGIKSDKDNFKVVLDIGQYTREEMSIHATPHHVLVEGKHEEKEDEFGSIERKFTRKFFLPRDVFAEDVRCHLTSNGILEIIAPKSKQSDDVEGDENLIRVPIHDRKMSTIEQLEISQ